MADLKCRPCSSGVALNTVQCSENVVQCSVFMFRKIVFRFGLNAVFGKWQEIPCCFVQCSVRASEHGIVLFSVLFSCTVLFSVLFRGSECVQSVSAGKWVPQVWPRFVQCYVQCSCCVQSFVQAWKPRHDMFMFMFSERLLCSDACSG